MVDIDVEDVVASWESHANPLSGNGWKVRAATELLCRALGYATKAAAEDAS
jgi:hypothetical protein